MRYVLKGLVCFWLLCLLNVYLIPNVQAVTYSVDNTSSDQATPNSLPWCVSQSNASSTVDDTIVFSHANSITVHLPLWINDRVNIKGNNNVIGAHDGSGGNPIVAFGLSLQSSGSTMTALAIVDSLVGISISSDQNWIYNCRFGLDYSDVARGNQNGISINGGHYNQIGGSTPAERNIVSNSSATGIWVGHSRGNNILGNYLGTNPAGTSLLGSQTTGILLAESQYCKIGGNISAGEGNLICGSTGNGISIYGTQSQGNTVCGNIIGLDINENNELGNGRGVFIEQAVGNYIGSNTAFQHYNVIAGNTNQNIYITDNGGARPRDNVIQNNFIGVNSSVDAKANNVVGIYLQNADNNLIGGARVSFSRNVIASNNIAQGYGVHIENSSGNTVSGNFIGNDGLAARSNTIGLYLTGSSEHNLIGGADSTGSAFGNIISGNTQEGIIQDGGIGNKIQSNIIGLNYIESGGLGNGSHGILIQGAADDTTVGGIPGFNTTVYNVISANGAQGIRLSNTQGHQLINNYIGLDSSGLSALPNAYSLALSDAAYNLVANNKLARRTEITNVGAFGNTLVGNRISVYDNDLSVPGTQYGVYFSNGASGNFIGLQSAGQGNLISGVSIDGILVDGVGTEGNGLFGNTITSAAGLAINLNNGGNSERPAPTISSAVAGSGLGGTALPNDYIEVFIAEGAAGHGGSIRYLGHTTADGSGHWAFDPGGYSVGEYVCALATDSANNTSPFSANIVVTVPTATPTPTTSATITQTYTSTPTFTITPSSTITPTITPSPTFTVTSTQTPVNILSGLNLGGRNVLPFPNPAHHQMTFVFHLTSASEVKIKIYNMAGEQIALLAGNFQAGQGQTLVWDCSSIAAGVYLARYLVDGLVKEKVKLSIFH